MDFQQIIELGILFQRRTELACSADIDLSKRGRRIGYLQQNFAGISFDPFKNQPSAGNVRIEQQLQDFGIQFLPIVIIMRVSPKFQGSEGPIKQIISLIVQQTGFRTAFGQERYDAVSENIRFPQNTGQKFQDLFHVGLCNGVLFAFTPDRMSDPDPKRFFYVEHLHFRPALFVDQKLLNKLQQPCCKIQIQLRIGRFRFLVGKIEDLIIFSVTVLIKPPVGIVEKNGFRIFVFMHGPFDCLLESRRIFKYEPFFAKHRTRGIPCSRYGIFAAGQSGMAFVDEQQIPVSQRRRGNRFIAIPLCQFLHFDRINRSRGSHRIFVIRHAVQSRYIEFRAVLGAEPFVGCDQKCQTVVGFVRLVFFQIMAVLIKIGSHQQGFSRPRGILHADLVQVAQLIFRKIKRPFRIRLIEFLHKRIEVLQQFFPVAEIPVQINLHKDQSQPLKVFPLHGSGAVFIDLFRQRHQVFFVFQQHLGGDPIARKFEKIPFDEFMIIMMQSVIRQSFHPAVFQPFRQLPEWPDLISVPRLFLENIYPEKMDQKQIQHQLVVEISVPEWCLLRFPRPSHQISSCAHICLRNSSSISRTWKKSVSLRSAPRLFDPLI